jgi:hypothetical protein
MPLSLQARFPVHRVIVDLMTTHLPQSLRSHHQADRSSQLGAGMVPW